MSLTKSLLSKIAVFVAAAAAFTSLASAQTVKVDVASLEVQLQESPDIEFKRTKDKKWTARNWLEIETSFKADSTDSKSDFIDELEFHYYVYFDGQSGPPKLYTKMVKTVNIPKNEGTYTIAYMTPNTLESVFGKGKTAKSSDVWVAVEVKYRGATVGGKANKNESKKWWTAGSAERVQGAILAKGETPFQLLWYDRHVEEKKER